MHMGKLSTTLGPDSWSYSLVEVVLSHLVFGPEGEQTLLRMGSLGD